MGGQASTSAKGGAGGDVRSQPKLKSGGKSKQKPTGGQEAGAGAKSVHVVQGQHQRTLAGGDSALQPRPSTKSKALPPSRLPVPVSGHTHKSVAPTNAHTHTQAPIANVNADVNGGSRKKLVVRGLKRYKETHRLTSPPIWTKEFPCRSRYHVDSYIYDFERDQLTPGRTTLAMSGCAKKGGRCDRCGIYCANICQTCRRCPADCQCVPYPHADEEDQLRYNYKPDPYAGDASAVVPGTSTSAGSPNFRILSDAERLLADMRTKEFNNSQNPLPSQYPFNSAQPEPPATPSRGVFTAPFLPPPPPTPGPYQQYPMLPPPPPNMCWPYMNMHPQNPYMYPGFLPPPPPSNMYPFPPPGPSPPQQFGDYAPKMGPAALPPPVYRQYVSGMRRG